MLENILDILNLEIKRKFHTMMPVIFTGDCFFIRETMSYECASCAKGQPKRYLANIRFEFTRCYTCNICLDFILPVNRTCAEDFYYFNRALDSVENGTNQEKFFVAAKLISKEDINLIFILFKIAININENDILLRIANYINPDFPWKLIL